MFKKIEILHSISDVQNYVEAGKNYFVLASEGFDFLGLKDVLNASWMGGVFPKIFTQGSIYSDKAFLCELSQETNQSWIQSEEGYFCIDCSSYMVIVNGLDPYVNSRLEEIFSLTPFDSVMIGGGVGRINMNDIDCMYNGKEFVNRGVIVIGSSSALSVGVKHGYQSDNGYYNLTKCNGNILETIDNENAFTFYKTLVKLKYNIEVTEENLFEVGLKYPFLVGITYGEDVVRTPVKTDGKSIWTVGEVTKDTFLSIGQITDAKLLDAAKESAHEAKKNFACDASKCLVFDCLGRFVYSEERFLTEVAAIRENVNDLNLFGVLALGEIANTSTSNLEFYNNTCVVGVE